MNLNYVSMYILCNQCGNQINAKNIKKHKTKCINKGNKVNEKVKNKSKIQGVSDKFDIAYNPLTERKTERNLDGSRDYSQIREHGKFGSHSLYDDMNDEASA